MYTFATKITAAAMLMLSLVVPAKSEGLDQPKGDTVLVIAGMVTKTNGPMMAKFDMDMLKSLPAVSFKTSTNWTTGITSFTGVSLKALLAAAGASGGNLHAIALNDYAVDIPVADAVDDGPIIAYLMDGAPMSPRDKGPLWIVYPFDSKSSYKTEAIYSRAIWQLNRIEVQK